MTPPHEDTVWVGPNGRIVITFRRGFGWLMARQLFGNWNVVELCLRRRGYRPARMARIEQPNVEVRHAR